MPKVSIILPLHNSAEYLADTLASIQMQTLDGIELICVDDASTDATVRLVRLFEQDFPSVRLISFPENRGVSAARNEGMRMAQGEYLCFIDDDDWYPLPETLERMYDAARTHDAPVVGGSFSEYDNRSGRITSDYRGRGHLSCFTFEHEGRLDYRAWQGDFGFQRFMFKRSLIADAGILFPPYRRHEDPVFLVRALLEAGWFYAIPDVVYRYRYHHKPRLLAPETIDEAFEAIADVLAVSAAYDLPKLRAYQIELMKAYAHDYYGLMFCEDELLQMRTRLLRGIMSQDCFQKAALVVGKRASSLRLSLPAGKA